MGTTKQPPHMPGLDSLRIAPDKRKKDSSGKRWLWIAVALLLVILGAAAGYAYLNARPEVEVAVARKPTAGGPVGVLNASGYVTPRRRATIAAKITGRVTRVLFDEGTRVSEGQLLATLDDSDARRALDAAQADRNASQAAITDYEVQLRNAEIELHRAEVGKQQDIGSSLAGDGKSRGLPGVFEGGALTADAHCHADFLCGFEKPAIPAIYEPEKKRKRAKK